MAKAQNIKQESKQEFQSVLCDICLDEQTPALKTCLKCEISMCAQHLQTHLTTPVLLQTHPLTKPIAPGGLSSGAVRCPEHSKLLEYYCLDDRTCVCVSCSIEDQHRLHNMKTFPSAHKVLVEKLREELKGLAEREKQGKALKSWETEQTEALQESGKQLVKGVSVLCDIGLTKVQNSVAARLGVIQTARQNIQAALSEEDTHLFLQRYAKVHEALEGTQAVDFIHGLEKNAEPEKVVSDLFKYGYDAIKKVKKLQRDLLVLVDPHNQYWGVTKPTNVTFDPKTLGEHFLVSSDFKMLFCRSPAQLRVPQSVFLQNDLREDLCWGIQFSDQYDWCIGIGEGNVTCTTYNMTRPLYGLEWKNEKIIAFNTELNESVTGKMGGYSRHHSSNVRSNFSRLNKVIEYPTKSSFTPQVTAFQHKLQVQWDCTSHTLSFFTRGDYDEMICLHSVTVDFFSRYEFRPFVTLEKKPVQSTCNPSPLPRNLYVNAQNQSVNQSSQHVNFVCSLDDDNLLAVYSRGQRV